MAPLSPPNLVGGSTSGLADVSQCGGSYSSIVNEDGFNVKTRAASATTDTVGNIGQTFAYPRPAGGSTGIPRVSLMSGELKHPGVCLCILHVVRSYLEYGDMSTSPNMSQSRIAKLCDVMYSRLKLLLNTDSCVLSEWLLRTESRSTWFYYRVIYGLL